MQGGVLSWLGNSFKGVCYRGSEIRPGGCVIVARKFIQGGVLSIPRVSYGTFIQGGVLTWLENSSRGV